MARRRFDDDEEYDDRPRRRDSGGGFPWVLVLGILGGLAALTIVVCGGLIWAGMRKAEKMVEQVKADMAKFEAEAKERDAKVVADADATNPPPAGPVRQPPASKFDQPGEAGRWTVLFRSADPKAWNTDSAQPDSFAVSVWSAPKGTKYLRLRRMDTGDTLIMELERGRLLANGPEAAGVQWHGTAEVDEGVTFLGIADTTVSPPNRGATIVVSSGDSGETPGSGFGRDADEDPPTQKYAWKGKAIPRTVFEVAVTAGELTDAERKWLRK